MIVLIVDGEVKKFWRSDMDHMACRRDFLDHQHYYIGRYPGQVYELAELVPDVFFELQRQEAG